MTKKPFFSIVIPTFNRKNDLKFAITCLLQQSYKNFEIIVSDNHSTDDTEKIIQQLCSKKIKYNKNDKNLGWIPNLEKGISLAKGKYIILHGDDDFLFEENGLRTIKNLLSNNNYGFLRVNYLSIFSEKNMIFDFNVSKHIRNNYKIGKESSNKNIIDFIEKVDPYFLTGIIFKNEFKKAVEIINSEFIPWFKIIFYHTYNNGGYYLSDPLFVASWAKKLVNPNHPLFYLKNGRFLFENYFKEVSNLVDKIYYKKLLRKHIFAVIRMLPANKYSTNNVNVINCSKRILQIYPKYKFSLVFWLYTISSLIAPKWILKMIRDNYLKKIYNTETKNSRQVKAKINYLRYQIS